MNINKKIFVVITVMITSLLLTAAIGLCGLMNQPEVDISIFKGFPVTKLSIGDTSFGNKISYVMVDSADMLVSKAQALNISTIYDDPGGRFVVVDSEYNTYYVLSKPVYWYGYPGYFELIFLGASLSIQTLAGILIIRKMILNYNKEVDR